MILDLTGCWQWVVLGCCWGAVRKGALRACWVVCRCQADGKAWLHAVAPLPPPPSSHCVFWAFRTLVGDLVAYTGLPSEILQRVCRRGVEKSALWRNRRGNSYPHHTTSVSTVERDSQAGARSTYATLKVMRGVCVDPGRVCTTPLPPDQASLHPPGRGQTAPAQPSEMGFHTRKNSCWLSAGFG